MTKMDYSLETPEERVIQVQKIINEQQEQDKDISNHFLETLADYIIFAADKEERKQRKIITSNRAYTIGMRETSYEALASSLENGEDGIYHLTSDLGKQEILTKKDSITNEDIESLPDLKVLREAIEKVEEAEKNARGKEKYTLHKQLIEMRQQQYIIKNERQKPIHITSYTKGVLKYDLSENIIVEGNKCTSDCIISLFNPYHVSTLLCNYSELKQESYGQFGNDFWYLLLDLENVADAALRQKNPMLYDIMIYKIDKKSNAEIRDLITADYGSCYTPEYLSALWRKKIPKLIAEEAVAQYIDWYYLEKDYGKYKKCSKCGQIKLANNSNFSINKTAADGFYSICKCCRNSKKKG